MALQLLRFSAFKPGSWHMQSPLGESTGPFDMAEYLLEKAPTGIDGFDDISGGGLPRGRCTLVSGGSGCGKTIFGIEFLVQGALRFSEPGVLMSFEESSLTISQDVCGLGFNLPELINNKQLVIESCRIYPAEVVTVGDFELEGLFLRLDQAINAVGARRVVLDSIESLLSSYGNSPIVRAELLRLFDWLNDRGLTSVVIGERGLQGELSRYGVEEYVSDCVILLDQRLENEICTRRLRLVKYRGSAHSTNEFPFIISSRGFSVRPITAVMLNYVAGSERISTGMPQLDEMLDGGIYRHSSLLISGYTGTGKTTVVCSIVCEVARRGERVLLVSSEESPDQLVRDMASVAIDLKCWIDLGLLNIWCERTTATGVEERIGTLEQMVLNFKPTLVAIDGISSLTHVGSETEVNSIVVREVDLLRSHGITVVLSALSHGNNFKESVVGISSIIDTWILVRNTEGDGERNRLLTIVKARGINHSNQVREFRLTSNGPELVDVVIGTDGVLTGSARSAYQDRQERLKLHDMNEIKSKQRVAQRNRREIENKIDFLRQQLEDDSTELELITSELEEAKLVLERQTLLRSQHRGEFQ